MSITINSGEGGEDVERNLLSKEPYQREGEK